MDASLEGQPEPVLVDKEAHGDGEMDGASSELKDPSLSISQQKDHSVKSVNDEEGKDEDPCLQPKVQSECEEDAKNDDKVSTGFKIPSVIPKSQLKHEQEESSAKDEGKATAEFKVPSVSLLRPKNQSKPVSEIQNKDTGKAAKSSSTDPPPPPLPYNEPTWSSTPQSPFILTVIKNGTILETIQLSLKPFHVFGRLPSCDVQLEHPSISRYHAILQYRPLNKQGSDDESSNDALSVPVVSSSVSTNPTEEGFYVYDLGSTHGTFINKTKIQMRCFYRLRVGQMVKFGGSSRLFLLEVRTVLSLLET